MSRTIAITSGKGGVGKTNLSVNLAINLAELGYRTCLFDADLGTANINILLGINPKHDIGDVISGEKTLQDIVIRDQAGIDIIPGSSGVEDIANLGGAKLDSLVKAFSTVGKYDFYIFDTAAGISRNVISFCLAASEVVLVVTPEPTSMTDAYSLLKVLSNNGYGGIIKVIVNRCPDPASAREVYKKFRMAVDKYLGIAIQPLGVVYQDDAVPKALQQQQPFMKLFPQSSAANCIKALARRLIDPNLSQADDVDMTTFWNKCFQYFSSPLDLPGKKKDAAPRGERAATPSPQPEVEKAEESPTVSEAQHVGEVVSAESAEESTQPSPKIELGTPSAAVEQPSVEPSAESGAAIDLKGADGLQIPGPVIVENRKAETAADPVPVIMPIVERLTESIAMLSDELRRVREIIESNGTALPRESSSGFGRQGDGREFTLDLLAYIDRNSTQKKDA